MEDKRKWIMILPIVLGSNRGRHYLVFLAIAVLCWDYHSLFPAPDPFVHDPKIPINRPFGDLEKLPADVETILSSPSRVAFRVVVGSTVEPGW
jgi:hypothetical protein